jgi:hypothetical protein
MTHLASFPIKQNEHSSVGVGQPQGRIYDVLKGIQVVEGYNFLVKGGKHLTNLIPCSGDVKNILWTGRLA